MYTAVDDPTGAVTFIRLVPSTAQTAVAFGSFAVSDARFNNHESDAPTAPGACGDSVTEWLLPRPYFKTFGRDICDVRRPCQAGSVAYQTPLTVKETLERVAQRRLVLPAIQREYVWATDPDRMTRLFDSLLRKYPIGTFLFWDVPANNSRSFDFYEVMRDWHERDRRHNPRLPLSSPRDLTAVLDGQQRLTTLNIGLHGSLAQRGKYKRATSLDAYPIRHLYVDLLFEPGEDDDVEYRFAFLTKDQSADDGNRHWYRVGNILEVPDPGLPILRYAQAHDLTHKERPFEVMARLWAAVHQDGVVSAFEEKGEKLDRVLDIFVRVNSGGVVLSKSDLLLSMATAHFRSRDARQEVHQLVDELNIEGDGFAFSKDLILKAGLVMTGISDIGFRVENFTAANMARLEDSWDRLTIALRLAARLLGSFGLSAETLPANSVLVPLADYLYARGHSQTFLESQSPGAVADRRAIRSWTLRTILMPGIWGSGLDGLLRGLHRAIVDSAGPFPVAAIEAEMARRGKKLEFNSTLVDNLLDTPYRHARTFALLTLMYETVDTLSRFHIDHVFPRALATRTKLHSAGVPEDQVEGIRDRVERLPNLQLLHGPVNVEKRAKPPYDWVSARFPDEDARRAWLAESDLLDLPNSFREFDKFYACRRNLMQSRLVRLLAVRDTPQPDSAETHEPTRSTPVAIEPVRPSHGTPGPHPQPTDRLARTRQKEKIADLIADGRLHVGDELHAHLYGQRYAAVVQEEGLLMDNALHASPSSAARVVTNGVSVNGWAFWKTASDVSIAELRRW